MDVWQMDRVSTSYISVEVVVTVWRAVSNDYHIYTHTTSSIILHDDEHPSRHLPVDPSGHISVMSTMLMISTPAHFPHSSVGKAPLGYDWMRVFDAVRDPDQLKPPGRVSVPVVTVSVLVENVLVVTVLVEPVSVGNVDREPLPVEVRDPTLLALLPLPPLEIEIGGEKLEAPLPVGRSELSDDRIDEPRVPGGGRELAKEPVAAEPVEAGSAELIGGGAP